MMMCAIGASSAQPREPIWEPVTPADDLFREPLASVGLQPGDRGLLKSVNIAEVARVERPEFCIDTLCQTFVLGPCSGNRCAWTAIMAENRFSRLKLLLPVLDGAEFLEFPLKRDRKIVVMRTPRAVAVVGDLGVGPAEGERR
jgi:hypothetical protein